MTSAPFKTSMGPARRLVVHAHHDPDTGGWWADSDDIPGLVTEASTYDELVERVIAVVPELCAANNLAIRRGDSLHFEREGAMRAKNDEELSAALSKLGERIWTVAWNDEAIVEAVHELIAAKLAHDGVAAQEIDLSESAVEAIFGEATDTPNIVRPKRFVRSADWAKNSLYNLAARWILDEALARMRIEQPLPWDEVTKAGK